MERDEVESFVSDQAKTPPQLGPGTECDDNNKRVGFTELLYRRMDSFIDATMDPSEMESFLDDKIQSECETYDDDFKVTFDYRFLTEGIRTSEELPEIALPETKNLWCIRNSKEHQHLLKHPVIASFLWCKWILIRWKVNRNLRFSMSFVMLLTW